MRWIWYFLKNVLLSVLVLIMGCSVSAGLALILTILGVLLIVSGLGVFASNWFVDSDGDLQYMGFGSQLLAAAIFCVPGYLLIKFAGNIVNSFGWFVILAGAFFVIMGMLRLRACQNEACSLYVTGFASVCSVLYPILMMAGGVFLALTYLNAGLETLSIILLIASSILWILRTVLVIKDNRG